MAVNAVSIYSIEKEFKKDVPLIWNILFKTLLMRFVQLSRRKHPDQQIRCLLWGEIPWH